MFAQHALTPAVNRRNRRLIHPLCGDFKLAGTAWPLFARRLLAQLGNDRVRRRQVVAESAGRVHQTSTNTIAQFLRRGLGKGHNKNFRGQQSPREVCFAALPQDQTKIKRGDSEGLTGAGTGFDQAATAQRAAQSQGRLGRIHA